MIPYSICLQERPYWCVPACLQSILASEGFEISQKQIAKELKIDEEWFDFKNGKLDSFLAQYDLLSEFQSQFLGPVENDLILKESLGKKDIIVAREFEGRKHCNIVIDYHSLSDLVTLQDPMQEKLRIIDLGELNNSILPAKNKNYGFYLIDGK